MPVQGAPETPNSFRNLKTSLPATWHFHMHSAVWSLVEMGMYLPVLIHFSTSP